MSKKPVDNNQTNKESGLRVPIINMYNNTRDVYLYIYSVSAYMG